MRAMSIYAAFGGEGIASYEYTGKSRAVYSATRTGGSPAKRDRGGAAKGGYLQPSAAKGRCQTSEPSGQRPVKLQDLFPQPFYTTCGEAVSFFYLAAEPPPPPSARRAIAPFCTTCRHQAATTFGAKPRQPSCTREFSLTMPSRRPGFFSGLVSW